MDRQNENLYKAIISILREMVELGPGFTEASPLVNGGILDSMSILEFVEQIETCFGIEIPDELLTADTFHSVERLTERLVELL